MNKLYNNDKDFTSRFIEFLKNAIPGIPKTQLNIIPYIILGMILGESCSAQDIAKKLKPFFSDVQLDSITKRIRRFFTNKLFNAYDFYQKFIIYILKSYKVKHSDKTVYVVFDHMFSHDNYTIFMITLRIGTQGIPLWFKCFKGINKNDDAFKIDTIKEGITAVSKLFQNSGLKLIFLADRWFGYPKVLQIIEDLNHVYCIRIKGNVWVYKDGIKIKSKKLKHRKHHSVIHKDVLITDNRFKTNIVYSPTENTKDPWIIVTNGDPKKALKSYGYRFGSIECMFKNQKTNGFNLEKISNANIESFTTMYTMICVGVTYLTILGTEYSKNSSCYKKVKINTHKNYINELGNKIKKRVMSLFNTGLTLFNIGFNSEIYIRIPVSFQLYDV